MGTKLDCSIFDPLARSSSSNSSAAGKSKRLLLSSSVNDWDFLHYTSCSSQPITHNSSFQLHPHNSSMDKMLEKHNMESIKKTMQLHEDIFEHQVRELHRLYSVQKMLMDELKREIKHNRFWLSSTGLDSTTNQYRQYSSSTSPGVAGFGYSFTIEGLTDHHQSSRERSSGSCSGPADTMRIMTRGFDIERVLPPAQDQEDIISTGVSAVRQDYSSRQPKKIDVNAGSVEDSEVELTLSIGGSSTNKINRSSSSSKGYRVNDQNELGNRPEKENSSASFRSERGDHDCGSTGGNTPMSSSSTTSFDQERKRPHWLFQGLSINRT